MIRLKDIKPLQSYSDIIYKKILEFFNDVIFDYIAEINKRPLLNGSGIEDDLMMGKLFYEKGRFYSEKGFTNNQAKQLERIGARFDSRSKSYVLEYSKIPLGLKTTISRVNVYSENKIKDLLNYLAELQENTEFITSKISFYDEVEKIGEGLDKQFKVSMAKVNEISYDLTKYQLREIAKNYTNNLDFYIKKWTEKEISKMRLGIQELVMKGARSREVAKYIMKEKAVGERKAKFLARQETKLFVAEYQKNRFKMEGITTYIWRAVMDQRTRDSHRKLNGKMFSWDEPPIIDDTTGQRGNPSEAYNCRCVAVPVVPDNYLKGGKFD